MPSGESYGAAALSFTLGAVLATLLNWQSAFAGIFGGGASGGAGGGMSIFSVQLNYLLSSISGQLPNFWNVLKGDMHLVGPRPDIEENIRYYTERGRRKLEVKPGITGLSQVMGRGTLTFHEINELDFEYVATRSLRMDLRILFAVQEGSQRAAKVAAGWDGDRYAILKNASGERLLVWAMQWDSEAEARQFCRAYRALVEAREGTTTSSEVRSVHAWKTGKEQGVIQRYYDQVFIVEADATVPLQPVLTAIREARFSVDSVEAQRDKANPWLQRYNPVLAWQADGDYQMTRVLWGLGVEDLFLSNPAGQIRSTSNKVPGLSGGSKIEVRRLPVTAWSGRISRPRQRRIRLFHSL